MYANLIFSQESVFLLTIFLLYFKSDLSSKRNFLCYNFHQFAFHMNIKCISLWFTANFPRKAYIFSQHLLHLLYIEIYMLWFSIEYRVLCALYGRKKNIDFSQHPSYFQKEIFHPFILCFSSLQNSCEFIFLLFKK